MPVQLGTHIHNARAHVSKAHSSDIFEICSRIYYSDLLYSQSGMPLMFFDLS
jgi:hypothetical protein